MNGITLTRPESLFWNGDWHVTRGPGYWDNMETQLTGELILLTLDGGELGQLVIEMDKQKALALADGLSSCAAAAA
jgi:hypothetical protein